MPRIPLFPCGSLQSCNANGRAEHYSKLPTPTPVSSHVSSIMRRRVLTTNNLLAEHQMALPFRDATVQYLQ